MLACLIRSAAVWAVSAEWLGAELPPFVSMISGRQMGPRAEMEWPYSERWSKRRRNRGLGVGCDSYGQKMSPDEAFSVLTGTNLVSGSHLHFVAAQRLTRCFRRGLTRLLPPPSDPLNLFFPFCHF